MRYALLICTDEKAMRRRARPRPRRRRPAYMKFGEEMGRRGVLHGGERPAPDDRRHHRAGPRRRGAARRTARSPRPRSRSAASTSSTAKDLDEAIEIAAKIPGAQARVDRSAADLGDVAGPPSTRRRRAAAFRDGVGSRRRDPDPGDRRLGPRRGVRAGRLRAGRRALAARRHPAHARRVADHDRPQPRARPPAPATGRERRRSSQEVAVTADRPIDGPRRRGRRQRRRRRPAAARSSPAATRRSSLEAQVALTLRTLAGLTTAEIARAFLVPEPTMAQAPRAGQAQDPQRRDPVPGAARPPAARTDGRRCSRSLYLLFNEGYAATAGADLRAGGAVRRGDPAGAARSST